MLEEAINEIKKHMDSYPDIYKFSIVDDITIYYTLEEYEQKSFSNTIELIAWCENNLEQKL
ncbi:hypothetical protein SAMN04489761_3427 [Tenacibaculum sp. MAR_2009_124]|uniref:hypothetical protein n=1 Tax=Tenacibaculum sp. MAR_2009_124 TaxID=1250059 RepID=UPI000897552F|nr:hypothetical protein [Tenacibaculum sp. MAR_2009_124]SEC66018.1 hypothetical protein SAMN04489761_3427 [Tenacibaculum sp. MAR_2009_124]